mgnify:FL=1
MTLTKIITVIIVIWIIIQVKQFIRGIQVNSNKTAIKRNKNDSMNNMDIQDGDYEEVE